MFKIILVITLCLQIVFSIWYYNTQNKTQQIGGPIARPKIFWLGFTSYNYFVLSLLLWWGLKLSPSWNNLLLIFIGCIYFRAVIQSLFMFVLHIWIPPMGIFYNIFCFLLIAIYTGFNSELLFNFAQNDSVAAGYMILICASLITDSVYAYKFFKLVGEKTKGKEAIWYASEEDPIFKKIVQLTRNLNIVFTVYYIYLLFKIFTA
jgi:hypothetical protein